MHRINAAAIFSMIGSGWRIYNDDGLFGWLHFPDFLVIGKCAQYGLQWHFFGIWIARKKIEQVSRSYCHGMRRGH
jgi:thiosulfate reductase cytochrome b subunit